MSLSGAKRRILHAHYRECPINNTTMCQAKLNEKITPYGYVRRRLIIAERELAKTYLTPSEPYDAIISLDFLRFRRSVSETFLCIKTADQVLGDPLKWKTSYKNAGIIIQLANVRVRNGSSKEGEQRSNNSDAAVDSCTISRGLTGGCGC